MNWFADQYGFDPSKDSKVPVKRGPFWILLRGVHTLATLTCARHPGDAWLWLRSMIARRRPLSMAIPWLTFDAIRAIRQQLPANPTIFEFGSGHSTLYWVQLGATVVAVEDDAGWHQMLRAALDQRGPGTARLVLAQTLDSYVGAIHECAPASQDLVLVDGAHRRNCVVAAIPYVKPGGMLVVDNTDWHWFRDHPIEGVPANWERSVYPGFGPMLGHRSETTVWRRPA